MTPARRRRLTLIAVLLVGLGAAAVLMLTAFRENMLYFYQPSAVAAEEVPPGTRFRMGGLVKPGSLSRSENSLKVRFRLADCGADVPVRYKGLLPDLFREGQGVVAHGRMRDGVFVADEILAKHDENYMSPEVAEAVQDESGKSCMPVNMRDAQAVNPTRNGARG